MDCIGSMAFIFIAICGKATQLSVGKSERQLCTPSLVRLPRIYVLDSRVVSRRDIYIYIIYIHIFLSMHFVGVSHMYIIIAYIYRTILNLLILFKKYIDVLIGPRSHLHLFKYIKEKNCMKYWRYHTLKINNITLFQ